MEKEVIQKKIINTCNTCRTPIYEGEPIYKSEVGQNTGTNAGLYGGYGGKVPIIPGEGVHGGGYGGRHSDDQSSEIWVQCAWCYDQWQAELAKSKWFWPKWLVGGVIFDIIATVIFNFIICPSRGLTTGGNWLSNYLRKEQDFGWLKFPFTTPIFSVVFFVLLIFLGLVFRPRVDRYKLREREEE